MTLSLAHPIAGGPALEDAGAYDRRWLVVDPEHAWLSLDQAPRLGLLELSLRFGYLVVRAPGMLRLDVPLDVIEDDASVERRAQVGSQVVRVVDEGDLAAAWLTEWLGQPCRLMKIHPEADEVAWPDQA
ncbi:MOSC N-terminal beta barrel domain-containing protein [Castellaniella sp.]|uniref:MOSC N-terminal beta barrel domain-containing protein n=1 Tax=Castellaniella sp. TaxID=1955812 RepID=UPI002AFE5807|nr:MOSC N-terminal beta barrel domain-containing protein [Castellaniella sp.]